MSLSAPSAPAVLGRLVVEVVTDQPTLSGLTGGLLDPRAPSVSSAMYQRCTNASLNKGGTAGNSGDLTRHSGRVKTAFYQGERIDLAACS